MENPKFAELILKPEGRKIESFFDDYCAEFREKLEKTQFIDTLCLMGNSYSCEFFKEFCDSLKNTKIIKKVILNDVFTSRKEGILDSLSYLNEVLRNKNIILLDLSNNAICPDGCERITDILEHNQTLKYLYFNHSALSQAGTITVCKAIRDGKLNLISF